MDMRISIMGSADIRIVCSVEKAKISDVSFEYVAIVAPSHRDFTPDALYNVDQRIKVYNIGKVSWEDLEGKLPNSPSSFIPLLSSDVPLSINSLVLLSDRNTRGPFMTKMCPTRKQYLMIASSISLPGASQYSSFSRGSLLELERPELEDLRLSLLSLSQLGIDDGIELSWLGLLYKLSQEDVETEEL